MSTLEIHEETDGTVSISHLQYLEMLNKHINPIIATCERENFYETLKKVTNLSSHLRFTRVPAAKRTHQS